MFLLIIFIGLFVSCIPFYIIWIKEKEKTITDMIEMSFSSLGICVIIIIIFSIKSIAAHNTDKPFVTYDERDKPQSFAADDDKTIYYFSDDMVIHKYIRKDKRDVEIKNPFEEEYYYEIDDGDNRLIISKEDIKVSSNEKPHLRYSVEIRYGPFCDGFCCYVNPKVITIKFPIILTGEEDVRVRYWKQPSRTTYCIDDHRTYKLNDLLKVNH